jgi:hypothetical protein
MANDLPVAGGTVREFDLNHIQVDQLTVIDPA